MFGKKTCSKCILPGDFPGADFDEDGVCSPCRDYKAGEGPYGWKNADEIKRLADKCEGYFAEAKESGSEYDCLVSLSGGKDSTALTDMMVGKYGMNPLLLSINTGFLDPQAFKNIKSIVPGLEKKYEKKLRHEFLNNPGLKETLKRIYIHGFQIPDERGYVHTICYKCAPLMEDIAMDIATSKEIPLVLEGYSPHQPDYDFMFFEHPEEKITHHHIPEWMTDKEGFSDEDRGWFWNPEKYPLGTKFPIVLAPWHVLPYSQNDVYRTVVEDGLISSRKEADPANTNCLLNWPMMYLDKKLLGHNPYIEEFARQVREGMASRREWKWKLKFIDLLVGNVMKRKEIKYVMDDLELNLKEIVRRQHDI